MTEIGKVRYVPETELWARSYDAEIDVPSDRDTHWIALCHPDGSYIILRIDSNGTTYSLYLWDKN